MNDETRQLPVVCAKCYDPFWITVTNDVDDEMARDLARLMKCPKCRPRPRVFVSQKQNPKSFTPKNPPPIDCNSPHNDP